MLKLPRASIVRILVIALLAVVILIGIAAYRTVRERAELVQSLRAAAPRTASDARPDPSPLFAPLPVRPDWFHWNLAAEQYEAVQRRASAGELGSEAAAAVAALDACAGDDALEALGRVQKVLRERDPVLDVPPCAREALRLFVIERAPTLALVRGASGYRPIDRLEILAQVEAGGPVEPWLPTLRIATFGYEIQMAVLEAAWNERPEEIVALLRAQRDLARIIEPMPFVFDALLTNEADLGLLLCLETALPYLPPGTDLAWLESELAAMRPRDRLHLALQCIRLHGNVEDSAFGGSFASGSSGGILSYLTRPFERNPWHNRVLAEMEQMEQPAFRRPAPAVREERAVSRKPPSGTKDQQVGVSLESNDKLEARLALARVALVAHRAGLTEAVASIPETIDPHSGKPLRHELRPDGVLRLWSVGWNQVDDGGDDQLDVVWRFRRR